VSVKYSQSCVVSSSTAPVLVVAVYGWHGVILDPLVAMFREWREVEYSSTDRIAKAIFGSKPTRESSHRQVCTDCERRETIPLGN